MLKSGQLSYLPSSCCRDRNLGQTITAASASLILQAASGMSQYHVDAAKSAGGKIDIMPPLAKIKDDRPLAGKAKSRIKPV